MPSTAARAPNRFVSAEVTTASSEATGIAGSPARPRRQAASRGAERREQGVRRDRADGDPPVVGDHGGEQGAVDHATLAPGPGDLRDGAEQALEVTGLTWPTAGTARAEIGDGGHKHPLPPRADDLGLGRGT